MPKSLKDQLKDWRAEKRELGQAREEARASGRAKADAAPKVPVREPREPAATAQPEESRELSDEELFARALQEVPRGGEAILQKYDRTDLPGRAGAQGPGAPRRDVSDQALFLQAVGEMTSDDVSRNKPTTRPEKRPADARFARRVQRGEVEPGNVLDLHGDDRQRALDRTRVFLDAEARARTEVVLVVHGKGGGVLSAEVMKLLDEHPLVVEHLVAPRDLGGDGARVVRLRSPGKAQRR